MLRIPMSHECLAARGLIKASESCETPRQGQSTDRDRKPAAPSRPRPPRGEGGPPLEKSAPREERPPPRPGGPPEARRAPPRPRGQAPDPTDRVRRWRLGWPGARQARARPDRPTHRVSRGGAHPRFSCGPAPGGRSIRRDVFSVTTIPPEDPRPDPAARPGPAVALGPPAYPAPANGKKSRKGPGRARPTRKRWLPRGPTAGPGKGAYRRDLGTPSGRPSGRAGTRGVDGSGRAGLRSATRGDKATRPLTRPAAATKSSAKDLSLRNVKLQSAGWRPPLGGGAPGPACCGPGPEPIRTRLRCAGEGRPFRHGF
jgi:hypothetical protein